MITKAAAELVKVLLPKMPNVNGKKVAPAVSIREGATIVYADPLGRDLIESPFQGYPVERTAWEGAKPVKTGLRFGQAKFGRSA